MLAVESPAGDGNPIRERCGRSECAGKRDRPSRHFNLNDPFIDQGDPVKKIITSLLAGLFLIVGLSACTSAADRADENLSKAAENFEVPRRIVGINAITDTVLFSVEGYCSYETPKDTIDVICAVDKTGKGAKVMRTTLGRSDNVTFVVTQLAAVDVDFFRPRIIFRPESIVPNFDLSTDDNPSE